MDDENIQKKILNYLDLAEQAKQEQAQHASLENKKQLFDQVLESMGLTQADRQGLSLQAEEDLRKATHAYRVHQEAQAFLHATRARKLMPFDERPLALLLKLRRKGVHADETEELALRKELTLINPDHPELEIVGSDPDKYRLILIKALGPWLAVFSITAGLVFITLIYAVAIFL